MDQDRLDRIARALGAGSTRRAGLRAALGGVLGGGLAAAATTDVPARRRRRFEPPCAAGQTCRKGACACDDGGTVCGASCCLVGQRCEGGTCVDLPNPDACIAYGEPCKGVGRRCCENLQCGSGQGGQDDVACWVRKTGRCASTAECIYGTECVEGICIAVLPPPPGPTCVVATCPGCALDDQIIPAAAEPACIDGACGCTCLYVPGTEWSGVGCADGNACPDPQSCVDMATDDPCTPGSAFCCCAFR